MPNSAQNQRIRDYFLTGMLAIAGILVFLLFRPYISILLLAFVFAVIFNPLFLKILKLTGKKEVLASILTTVIVILIFLVPLIIFGSLVIRQLSSVLQSPDQLLINVSNIHLPGILERANLDLKAYIENILAGFINDAGSIFSNLAKFFVYLTLTFLSLIYLFKDGHKIRRSLLNALPFTDAQSKKLTEDLAAGIRAVIGGYILVAVIQGIVSGFGFWIFGVPNPALWGFLTVLVALIPTFGTSLANIPAILYLLINGQMGHAIGLTIWYVAAISIIDNFIGPRFVSGRVRIHVLLLIFGIIGGINMFGTLGFIMGPLIIIFFWSILEMFQKEDLIEQSEPLQKY
jgi:predicted PurR-regulated permease PerM